MEDWGAMLLKYYNKDLSYMKTDFTINYLSYWTDNGIDIEGENIIGTCLLMFGFLLKVHIIIGQQNRTKPTKTHFWM